MIQSWFGRPIIKEWAKNVLVGSKENKIIHCGNDKAYSYRLGTPLKYLPEAAIMHCRAYLSLKLHTFEVWWAFSLRDITKVPPQCGQKMQIQFGNREHLARDKTRRIRIKLILSVRHTSREGSDRSWLVSHDFCPFHGHPQKTCDQSLVVLKYIVEYFIDLCQSQ